MPLIPMREMLERARGEKYAVGYFEAWDQYSFEAVLEAAEETRSPVILGFGGVMMNQNWFDNTGLEGLAPMGRAIAEDAKVPVSFLLNEVKTHDQISRGIARGFNAVMLDTSHLPVEQNIAQTRKVVEAAHVIGIDVEGECDPLPDASGTMGEHSGSKMTDPYEAARFAEETGIDALSIAIGNEHIRVGGVSVVDFDLLQRISEVVRVPLVIHGGTGFPTDAVARATELGVAKFNVGTVLKQVYLQAATRALSAIPDKPNFQELVGSRKESDFLRVAAMCVKAEVVRRMTIYGCIGRA
jgi:ketose-bisphosphate aldolase